MTTAIHRRSFGWAISTGLAAAAGGCADRSQSATVQVADLERAQLSFVRDGVTTREEVLLRFGVPSAQFEGERILTYRLGRRPEGALGPMASDAAVEDPRYAVWVQPTYNLVLVFDARNVLERHSFIEVR